MRDTLYAIRFLDGQQNTLKVDRYVGWDFCVEAAEEVCPSRCEWIEWHVIRDDVPPPKQIGRIYNLPLTESGWAAADDLDRYPL